LLFELSKTDNDLSNKLITNPSVINTSEISDVVLSPSGKILSAILAKSSISGDSISVIGSEPIIKFPENKPEITAKNLSNTVEFSGIFFESHILQWALGKRSIEDLKKEPQKKIEKPELYKNSIICAESTPSKLAVCAANT
jgi:hypothetical protein